MLKLLETIWLVIAVFSVVLASYSIFTNGLSGYDTVWFIVFSFVATAMFFIRRKQRISREKK